MRSQGLRRVIFALAGFAMARSFLGAGDAVSSESPAASARRVFFSNYFLVMAQTEIAAIPRPDRDALRRILDVCPGTLVIAERERLRCQLETQQFLMAHRRVDTKLYRLIDAIELMKTLVRYNLAIGRESEAGIDRRLATITAGLEDAVDSDFTRFSEDQTPPAH
jgi:hypothetical protein